MEYDLPTIIKMPVDDRLCVLEINKQDRALNAQEELDDLTSYETESIKSETEYQIELQKITCEKEGKRPNVFKKKKLIWTWPDMRNRVIHSLLDEAVESQAFHK